MRPSTTTGGSRKSTSVGRALAGRLVSRVEHRVLNLNEALDFRHGLLAWGVGQTITTPGGAEGRILIRDTWGTEIVPELKPQPEDLVLYKHRYSGFYQTELDLLLKQAGINQLIFTGCTTSVCVESTLRDAYFRDYQSLLLADCIDEPIGKGMPRSNHDASLTLVEAVFGWVASSEQFMKALPSS